MNIDDLKEIVKNCVYEEKGIACMNDTYYRDIMRTINNLQSKIDKAIKELEKEYENLPYIDEWYATDEQWHNYYFERNEQAEESISKAIDILKEKSK